MDRYVCIHGHFYQPPRENPWLEAIERQESAAPFHDWNERVSDECYRTNGRSRILDHEGWIVRIVNNYSRMSFNFGPTLLSWMETHDPDAYASVLEADRLSQERFGGHGAALAQCYNHLIMPLALPRDQMTQVRWGIRDFEHRFGRKPVGMWLPETAADLKTLEVLAAEGIRFTILAPRQARRFRPIGAADWTECAQTGIDPTRPYRVNLPSGASIAVFFYDGPVSQAVAFERLLEDGRHFANRLLDAFNNHRSGPQLAHIATDGESYGHHHRHGDMALAVALQSLDRREDLELTVYAQMLEIAPPEFEAEIHDNSSWSCVHGVERWRSDCGCCASAGAGWNQRWRTPLREALDFLRDSLNEPFEQLAGTFLKSPWEARNAYIDLILDRSDDALDQWMALHSVRTLTFEERVTVLRLMELQRHLMLMYTSCGWFFDDISGIETVQVLRYAARVLQLGQILFNLDLRSRFLDHLQNARSNRPDMGDGRRVFERFVQPTEVDLPRVGAHFAVNSMFCEHGSDSSIYCFDANVLEEKRLQVGRAKLAVGRVQLTSRITRAKQTFAYTVVHAGNHIISGGARPYAPEEHFEESARSIISAFEDGDLAGLIHRIEADFGETTFSLGSLFYDEQQRIAETICEAAIMQVESTYRTIHEHHQPLLRYMSRLGIRIPRPLLAPVQFIMNLDLEQELQRESPDFNRISSLLDAIERENIPIETATVAFAFESLIARIVAACNGRSISPAQLQNLLHAVQLTRRCQFDVDLATAQNLVWRLLVRGNGDLEAVAEPLHELAALLRVRVVA